MPSSIRNSHRRAALGALLAAALAMAATPAYAAEPVPVPVQLPVPVPVEPVTLVVGLHPGVPADRPADRLDDATGIDVIATEPVGGTGAVTVEVSAADAADAAGELRSDPAVRYVEVDRVAEIAAVTPDDPYFDAQWGLDRAYVPGAWRYTTGSRAVTVAVVDTGVSRVPDLAGALLAGWDFVNNDAGASDDHGHGTMTAGVLAARGDNGLATAGLCWRCTILPVKVLGSKGSGYHSHVAAGITWAADNGADIINLSLGGSSDSQVLRDAVAYAVAADVLVVAAAGNDGSTARFYPAAYPAVLGVGWSTRTDARHAHSNHGAAWVDLAAPGCNLAQAVDRTVRDFCGTSSAAPFAAGVAALALAADPTATAATLRAVLTATADPVTGGWVASGRVNAHAAVSAMPWSGTRDNTAPSVRFNKAPRHGFKHIRGTVRVTAKASDAYGVRRVDLLVDGRVISTETAAPYTFRVRSWRYGSKLKAQVRAYDRAGNVRYTTVRVWYR